MPLPLLYRLKPLVKRAIAVSNLIMRPMIVGVRAAAFDAQGRVFLVRHTYLPGWYMPGGGVEIGETTLAALKRELREEGNLECESPPRLFAIYLNVALSRRNHVAFYVVDASHQSAPPALPNREIAEAGFFALDALPDGVTAGTRRRLEEIAADARVSEFW